MKNHNYTSSGINIFSIIHYFMMTEIFYSHSSTHDMNLNITIRK